MKKFPFLLSMALTALMMMSQNMFADCSFTPNLFPGQAADRTAYTVSATVHVGEWGKCTTHMYSQIINLQTTNEDVVKVYNQGGYDAVFFVGVGTADVTYTENWFSGGDAGGGVTGLCATNHTIHYTVTKGTPVMYYADPEKGDPVTEYTTTNEARRPAIFHLEVKEYSTRTQSGFPEMITSNLGADPCTVTSSNTAVATIASRGNAVQPTGTLGQTTITATWAGNDNWNGATTSYVLKVEQAKTPVSITFPINNVADTLGKVIDPQTPTLRPTVSPIRWWSTDPAVASVNEQTGAITTHAWGSTWIHAAFDGDEDYYAADGAYCLTVLRKDPKLSFAEEDVYQELGVPFTPQALVNPFNVAVTWESSDPTVATIAADGSAITMLKKGATIITAKTNPDDPMYEYKTVSYSLHVTSLGLNVLGVEVTSLNAADILGNGKVNFDVSSRFLYLDGWNVDVTDSSAVIKNGVIKETTGMLTVMLKANSSIVGAQLCIDAPESGVYIRSLSKKDTLTLRADASESAIAVRAGGLKMHEALFYTYGSQFAIQCGDFNVTKYGHVFAQATSESGQAVMCTMFTKGEGGIGGIDILTPGVYWNDSHHAFWTGDAKTGKAAKQFEIGKVPMPLSSTQQTSIEFSVEDPEGHDNVVFSASAEDKFNDETKQLELTTTISDADITAGLESLIPGSSAWMDLLPGTIIFDVPAGSGAFQIQCQTLPGYSLKVKVGGEGVVSVTQTSLGWATVMYNVPVQTHVIVYLHAPEEQSAPARMHAQMATNDINAYVQAIKITPGASDKFYVVGTFNSWTIDENYRLTPNPGSSDMEYMINLTLTTTDQFKVKMDGETPIWYPDGMGNNYGENGEIAENGNYTIYFRPNGDGGVDWFYNVIYVEIQEPSAIDEVNAVANAKANKVLRDGQIYIIRDGKTYNALGTEIR